MHPILAAGAFLAGLALLLAVSGGSTKRSHDEWFAHWLSLKEKQTELERRKADLYRCLQLPGLSPEERIIGHQYLAELKQQSIVLRQKKAEAHHKWQENRRRLTGW
jgi:hypothetical protein